MKKAVYLMLFLLPACLTQAAKVDDFESYQVGTIASGVTGGVWTELTAGTSFARISEDSGNKFLQVGWPDGGRGAWRSIGPVANTSSATTLFLRLYVTSNSQDASFGLSDVTAPASVDWGNFEIQMILGNGDDANHANLRARDGGTAETYAALELNRWYNIWGVIDQTTDSYDMYLTTDLDAAIGTTMINPDPINFRNGTTTDLTTFLTLVNFRAMNFRIDQIYLTDGVDLSNPVANEPHNPTVQQTPNAPAVDVVLRWDAGADPAGIYAVNPDIVDEYVFMRSESDADPNLYYVGATGIDPGETPGSQFGPMSLTPGQTYYWAVVEAIDGYEQAFTAASALSSVDPNNITGPVWSFTADLLVPDFQTHPADQIVFPGEPTEFTVVLKDATDTSYQWYKNQSPISGAESATFAIASAQNEDEGVYYCLATNSSGSAQSLTAKLEIKRLRSYYAMESISIVDGNSLTPDSVGGYDMLLTAEAGSAGLPLLVENVADASLGIYSLLLDNGDHATDPNGQYGQLSAGVADYEDITITAWVYWNGGDNWQRVFDFGNDTSHYMFLTPSNGSRCRFVLNNGGGEQIVETTPLPTGEWLFIAATLGGDTGRIYVNGEQQAANAGMTINPIDILSTLNYVGKSQWPDPEFNGMIDELKIYNYELDAETVAAEYYQATGIQACFDPDFAGSAYNLDNTGSSYCKVDLADFAVFAANWLADGLWIAP